MLSLVDFMPWPRCLHVLSSFEYGNSLLKSIVIFGAGRVATALAVGFVAAGYSVTLAVRDKDTAGRKWKGPDVAFAGMADAARSATVVINAMPGDVTVAVLSSLKAELKGKVLVDVANATVRSDDGLPSGLVYSGSSLAEVLQSALSDTSVVKTLNTVASPAMANPGLLTLPASVFISGNDNAAKLITRGLLLDLGWQDRWIEDLGGIESARGTEALILLAPYIVRARGPKPFALTAAR